MRIGDGNGQVPREAASQKLPEASRGLRLGLLVGNDSDARHPSADRATSIPVTGEGIGQTWETVNRAAGSPASVLPRGLHRRVRNPFGKTRTNPLNGDERKLRSEEPILAGMIQGRLMGSMGPLLGKTVRR
jgi:hypothetical protein